MLFNSWTFIGAYLPVTLTVYWLLRRFVSARVSIAWLGLASYAFYISGETRWPLLILGSVLSNLLFARSLHALADGAARRVLFVISIAANLGALFVFKYLNWLSASLQPWFDNPVTKLALPVGISFFTFTQIAFLVDVWRRKASDLDPVRYALFVTFFPHLIAGPILHHDEMMPQFERESSEPLSLNLWCGLALFTIGLAKKVWIADGVAFAADAVFGQAGLSHVGLLPAWGGALAYTMQIYFDFSGYSDMALGLAVMFAIRLPFNFNSPYKATSITDFWRRWHITLSRFLRDYLYISLGGNRHGKVRRYVNLFVTMLLGGIWHGAGWTFVAWGALHGGLLVAHHAFSALRKRFGLAPLSAPIGWAITFVCVMVAWVPFRAPDFAVTQRLWSDMLGLHGFGGFAALLELSGRKALLLTLLSLGIACALPNSQQWLWPYKMGLDSPGYPPAPRLRWLREGLFEWRPNFIGVTVLGVVLGLALRLLNEPSTFIYFRF